jgi:hypothetical protein
VRSFDLELDAEWLATAWENGLFERWVPSKRQENGVGSGAEDCAEGDALFLQRRHRPQAPQAFVEPFESVSVILLTSSWRRTFEQRLKRQRHRFSH